MSMSRSEIMSSHAELSSEIESAIAKPLGLFGRFLFLDPKEPLLRASDYATSPP